MSGLHTSINTHLSRHFYPNDSPNLLLWQHKVGMHPVHTPIRPSFVFGVLRRLSSGRLSSGWKS